MRRLGGLGGFTSEERVNGIVLSRRLIRTLRRLILALLRLPYSIFGFTIALLRSVRTWLRRLGGGAFFLILFIESSRNTTGVQKALTDKGWTAETN